MGGRSIIGSGHGAGRTAPRGKVLRIGILQGGRIREERLIRAGHHVTVGESTRNTFVLPPSALPGSYKLFIARGNEYILAFREGMHGKVFINNTVVPLDELAGNVAARRGDAYWLSLEERNRGKVQIDGVTILFQFVDAPPEPKTAPVDFRPFGVRQLDWVFWGFFALSFVMNMVAYVWIQSQPAPGKVSIEDIPERYTTVWFTEDPEPEPVEDDALVDEDVDGDEPVADAADPEPAGDGAADGGGQDEGPRETPEERAQRIREELEQVGLAGVIGTNGQTSNDDAVADLVGDADRFADNLDAALNTADSVRVAQLGAVPELRDGIGDRHRDLESLSDTTGIGSGDAGDGDKGQAAVVPEVHWDPPILEPGSDATGIGEVIRKKKGQIKRCYEVGLNVDPDLAGRVEVVIVVAPDGSVDSTWIVDNATGDQELGDCMLRRIRHWQFPATGQAYEISYPFNLFPG